MTDFIDSDKWIQTGSNIYNTNLLNGAVGINTSGPTSNLTISGTQLMALQVHASGAANALVISGGNVGIATVSPGITLDVVGGGRFRNYVAPVTGSGLELGYGLVGSQAEILSIDRTTAIFNPLRIRGSGIYLNPGAEGNVGVGTNKPGALLDISGAATTYGLKIAGNNNHIAILDTGETDTAANTWFVYRTGGDDKLRFFKNADRIVLDNVGNVGIGVPNPAYNIHLSGTAPAIAMTNLGATNSRWISDTNPQNVNSTLSRLMVNWSGTTVSEIRFHAGSDSTNVNDGYMTFWTSSGGNFNEQMRIDRIGRIGIGTGSPLGKLHVLRDGSQFMIQSLNTSNPRNIYLLDGGTATKYNFLIGAQNNLDNGLEITPSTTVGGSTYSTPGISIFNGPVVGIGTTNPQRILHVSSGTTPLRLDASGIAPSATGSVWGSVGSILGIPAAWINIDVSGTSYKIPVY